MTTTRRAVRCHRQYRARSARRHRWEVRPPAHRSSPVVRWPRRGAARSASVGLRPGRPRRRRRRSGNFLPGRSRSSLVARGGIVRTPGQPGGLRYQETGRSSAGGWASTCRISSTRLDTPASRRRAAGGVHRVRGEISWAARRRPGRSHGPRGRLHGRAVRDRLYAKIGARGHARPAPRGQRPLNWAGSTPMTARISHTSIDA